MKNVLIFNGAPKRDGNTMKLIKEFTKGAESSGNTVKEIYLENLDIKGCIDCQYCERQEKGIIDPCIHDDDMKIIFEEFVKADVVVLASPVYWWTITGTLKMAVDRLYALYKNAGNNAYPKESILLMTAGGNDYTQPLMWYEGFEKWMNWKNIATILGSDKSNEARAVGEKLH